jgi:endonuclease IV
MFFVGAHISREKNLMDMMKNIIDAGGNSLQIFISNPRSINIGEINKKFIGNPDEIRSFIIRNNFKLIIHSPYTVNLSSPMIVNKRLIDIDECY